MSNSPLAALLDAYVEASVNHYLASKGLLLRLELVKGFRDVHAARAAILAAFATLEAERDDLKARLADLHRPTHGPCCTCQTCGKPYDECRCDIDDLADELAALRAALKQGREG